MTWLISTVSDNLIGQITHYQATSEIWSCLANYFNQQSMVKIMQLQNQLQTAKKGGESIVDVVLKIKTIGDELLAARVDVKEEDLMMSLLNKISYEFDLVVVLISSQLDTVLLGHAQYQYMLHEQRIV